MSSKTKQTEVRRKSKTRSSGLRRKKQLEAKGTTRSEAQLFGNTLER